MIDITKEEFLNSKYKEIIKEKNKSNKIKELITKYKIITILLASFVMLVVSNIVLIYNFFKTLQML